MAEGLTPQEVALLNKVLAEIQLTLNEFRIERKTSYTHEEANAVVAEARSRLQNIEIELFSVFRLLERFLDRGHSSSTSSSHKVLSVDQLGEIFS